MAPANPKYRRILLKLSGEALMGGMGYGIDPETVDGIARQIAEVHQLNVEIGVVVGGGNIFRGMASAARGMDRVTADYMGMLATVMNALAVQAALERQGIPSVTMSAISMRQVAEAYTRNRAMRYLQQGKVVVFGAGTGNPFFTTDTTAALRAIETGAEIIMKATKVDGIYSADPMLDPTAVKIDEIDYLSVLEKDLKVMDATAISLCRENKMPIQVFNLTVPGNIIRAVLGEKLGTIVKER